MWARCVDIVYMVHVGQWSYVNGIYVGTRSTDMAREGRILASG